MAVWESLAPRRELTTPKGALWLRNLSLTLLNGICVRLLVPLQGRRVEPAIPLALVRQRNGATLRGVTLPDDLLERVARRPVKPETPDLLRQASRPAVAAEKAVHARGGGRSREVTLVRVDAVEGRRDLRRGAQVVLLMVVFSDGEASERLDGRRDIAP